MVLNKMKVVNKMVYALVFAGGVGKRMNSKSLPKQFLEVHGKPILISTLEHFENHPEVNEICLVCAPEWKEYMQRILKRYYITKVKSLVTGGATALESQYNGLREIERHNAGQDDVVLIHDGVRPLIDEKTISDCIRMVHEKGSAITVVPATETIIQTESNGSVKGTFPREECRLARAPQCFYLRDILSAHEKARLEHKTFVDSCSLMLYYGHKLYTVSGPSENIKVTTPADFYIYRALLDARENSQIFGL